jgi:hypothetical protein
VDEIKLKTDKYLEYTKIKLLKTGLDEKIKNISIAKFLEIQELSKELEKLKNIRDILQQHPQKCPRCEALLRILPPPSYKLELVNINVNETKNSDIIINEIKTKTSKLLSLKKEEEEYKSLISKQNELLEKIKEYDTVLNGKEFLFDDFKILKKNYAMYQEN